MDLGSTGVFPVRVQIPPSPPPKLKIMNGHSFWWMFWTLNLVAFSESIFLPLPPDPILSAVVILSPSKAALSTLSCTISSALGGGVGYLLGFGLRKPIFSFLKKVFKGKAFKAIAFLKKYGLWAVFIAGFTPIPYKVFTITSGILKLNFWGFLALSILGRGLRFTGVALASLGIMRLPRKVLVFGAIIAAILGILWLVLFGRRVGSETNSST